jgi:hypothetical protein
MLRNPIAFVQAAFLKRVIECHVPNYYIRRFFRNLFSIDVANVIDLLRTRKQTRIMN